MTVDKEAPIKTGQTVNEAVHATQEETKKNLFPTNIVDLPSKGLFYPLDNPLSSGTVEIKYITGKEEDILTTESYIRTGVVIDKLLQSLLVSKINYNDLLVGDRNAIMVAARLYGYGKDYEITVTTPSGTEQKVKVDLETIGNKEFNEELIAPGQNDFEFVLPVSNVKLRFKLLTVGDQAEIDDRLKKHRLKVKGGARDIQLTTRLFQMIQAVDGNADRQLIKMFVENDLLAVDSRAFRNYITEIQPDVDLSVEVLDEESGEPFRTDVTIGPNFFWPDVRV